MQRLRLQPGIGHFPNLPSQQFKGKSRIGNHGDKLMEGDYHVGQILDTLKQLGIDDNTIVVFASDNGPQGETAREHGNQGTPDMGNSAPFRGELGEVTEGAIRTAAIIRWPGKVKPNTTKYAVFSIMDFLPTFAHIVGGKMPTDRPIDGVDQIDVLLGSTAIGHRKSLLSLIGADLVAARWKQWRIYFTDVHPTGIGPQRQPGMFSASAPGRTSSPLRPSLSFRYTHGARWPRSTVLRAATAPGPAAALSPAGTEVPLPVCSSEWQSAGVEALISWAAGSAQKP
jgi:hypothetical protein